MSIVRQITGFAIGIHRRDRLLYPAVFAIGLMLFLLQWAGGAYRAEFDGFPDESAQFVTGRMIWEYMKTAPRENPIQWAAQYYLHYPKVGLGHWPPGYHLAEAFWSLPFGSSRISAIWLQWFLALMALTGLYTIARPRFPFAITAGILFFAMATPIFQVGLEQTMSELLCLLCAVLFMQAMLRLLERRDRGAIYLVALSMLAAGMVKGTAVILLPVPAIALFAMGKPVKMGSPWPVVVILGACAACLAWYFSTTNVIYWAGITKTLPWGGRSLGEMAGWGLLGLACLGVRRNPLAILAASMLCSAVLVSCVVRAMTEQRHWIMVLPSILLLAGYALTRFNKPVAVVLAVLAIGLFPWVRYRQTPGGYRDLVRQLHRPARMLVSSAVGSGEGAWIAEISVAERYPASLVVRASKVLAESGWSGENYKLLVATQGEILKRLDELALDIVVIDRPSARGPPHQVLLEAAMAGNHGWRVCGNTPDLLAYCRTKAPAFPRKPLVLEPAGWRFEEKIAAGSVMP